MTHDLRNVSHIIFDWDGTIMNSASKIVSCMQQAAVLADLPAPSVKEVEHIIGISLLPAVQQLFSIDRKKAEEVCVFYKDMYLQHDQTPCPLFDGAHALLTTLSSRFTLGVATGKARRGLNRAFELSDTAAYFNASRCADEAESKPSPDMLKQLLNQWRIQSHQAVMIGDTTYDMKMAEAISMPRIGVSYGVHSVKAIAQHKPAHIIDTLVELQSILMPSA